MALPFVGETATHNSLRYSSHIRINADSTYAFIKCGPTSHAHNIITVDISDKENPSIVSDFDTETGVDGSNDYSYGFEYDPTTDTCFVTFDDKDEVRQIDMSDKLNPSQTDSYVHSTYANEVRGATVTGNYLVICTDVGNRVTILDIPNSLTYEGSVTDSNDLDQPYNSVVDGDYCYVITRDTTQHDLTVLDISNKAAPSIHGNLVADQAYTEISKVGNYCIVCRNNKTTWQIIDVSNPASPVSKSINSLASGAYNTATLTSEMGVPYVFICTPNWQVRVYDISDPTSPEHKETLGLSTYAKDIQIVGKYLYVPLFKSSADIQMQIYDVSEYLYDAPGYGSQISMSQVSFSTGG